MIVPYGVRIQPPNAYIRSRLTPGNIACMVGGMQRVGKRVQMIMPEEMLRWLDLRSYQLGINRSELVRQMVAQEMERRPHGRVKLV